MRYHMDGQKIDKRIPILSAIGCLVAILAGLAEHVEWLSSLCLGFSGGCRETAKYTVLRVPLWLWGVLFYVILGISSYQANRLMLWLAAAGFGVELCLLWVMFSSKILCVFCLGNALIIVLLFVLCFKRAFLWQIIFTSSVVLLVSTFLIPQPRVSDSSHRRNEDPVVAEVGGTRILESELEAPLASRIYELQHEIYSLKLRRLEERIVKILLEKEAEKQGVSVTELVNESILSEGLTVSDSELNNYYLENRGDMPNWEGSEDQLRDLMREKLIQKKAYQMIIDYAQSIRTGYDVVVHLKEPAYPLTQVNVEMDPVLGPTDAPVTVIEFSDYLCSACQKNHEVTRRIRERYAGKIRWIFKDFPFKGHELSGKAAEAAHCAADQGKFWEYQDRLYANKEELTVDILRNHAKELQLDVKSFDECLEGGQYRSEIEEDIKHGREAGVDTTPTFIVNGRLIPGGLSYERFEGIIEKELEKIGKGQI